jgi:hypothetical protein
VDLTGAWLIYPSHQDAHSPAQRSKYEGEQKGGNCKKGK